MANTSDYKRAYETAKKELADLLSQQAATEKRLVTLRKHIQSLAELCESEGVEIEPSVEAAFLLETSTLADEIRRVFGAANYDTAFRPGKIKDELEKLGRDLSQYQNPQSTIHMVLKRMAESGEIVEKTNEEGKTIYIKRHPAYGAFRPDTSHPALKLRHRPAVQSTPALDYVMRERTKKK